MAVVMIAIATLVRLGFFLARSQAGSMAMNQCCRCSIIACLVRWASQRHVPSMVATDEAQPGVLFS